MSAAAAQPPPPTVLELARAYVARGWRPFPVEYGGKRPAVGIKWGTATATAPPDKQLALWFGQAPMNIGIAAKGSGLVILDDDTGTAMAELCAAYGQPVPVTYRVRTAKGWHWYFRAPDDVEIGNAAGALKQFGFDVRGGRGDGGYVVAAGSRHESGHVYAAEDDDADEIELPWWLVELLLPEPEPAPGPEQERERDRRDDRRFTEQQAYDYVRQYAIEPLRRATEGTRNDKLNAAAMLIGHFVPDLYDYDEAREGLAGIAGTIGLDPAEIGPTIRSGLEAGMREPYTIADPSGPSSDGVAGEGDPLDADDDPFEQGVELRLRNRLMDAEAKRRQQAMERPPDPGPSLTSLVDLLAEPDDDEPCRIDQLWPAGGKVLLSAPQKSGKTTLVGNLVRSLADGARFLARPVRPGEFKVAAAGFEVTPLGGRRIALFDFEMTRRKLKDWLRDQQIASPDVVHVELMRGRSWDIRDPAVRSEWTQRLQALDVGVLVVDPIGPVLGSLGIEENDNGAVGGFLFALDALVREAGADELFVTHHTGHGAERARGASAFLGWPDANWTIVRDETTNMRAFKAEGRDVWVEETALVYDRGTRRLGLGEGDRASSRTAGHAEIIAGIVAENPGATVNDLKRYARDTEIGTKVQAAQDAVRGAEEAGLVHVHRGVNRSRLHYSGVCDDRCEGRDMPLAC